MPIESDVPVRVAAGQNAFALESYELASKNASTLPEGDR